MENGNTPFSSWHRSSSVLALESAHGSALVPGRKLQLIQRPTRLAGLITFSATRHVGDLLFAIGLGSLAPLWGFVILVAGETIRVLRLIRSPDPSTHAQKPEPKEASVLRMRRTDPTPPTPQWSRALRQEAAKWGLLLAMVVFTITLRDRLAKVLAGASVLVSTLLALRNLRHRPE
jgi:hypothetical protein